MSFSGKVVIVTGASSGIGATIAEMFCREGANVTLVGRSEAKLKASSERCSKAGGSHLIIKADVAKDIDAKKIIADTINKFGKLDILVNNAAVIRFGTLTEGTILGSFDEQVNINLRAAIHLTSLATPHLIKTKGNIVNISSVAGSKVSSITTTVYSVLKAALNQFTNGAALELADSGVRVNSISPGPVVTDIFDNASIDVKWDQLKEMTVLKRVSTPDEIGELVLFIASDKARGITGSNFVSDNGALLK